MRLLFIRHGDPDYSVDSLTETGWKEAEALADRMINIPMDEIYVSPLGRAKDTASITLQRLGREAVEYDWLREFDGRLRKPNYDRLSHSWDWLPQDWKNEEKFYDAHTWLSSEYVTNEGDTRQQFEYVTQNLDRLLAEHGYVREGEQYRVVRANRETLVFFCHFAVITVMLSHLIGASPMVLWHGLCASPTSVTTVYTEERRQGIASFRIAAFGDTSHLYAKGMEPSFSARFCETFDSDERHD